MKENEQVTLKDLKAEIAKVKTKRWWEIILTPLIIALVGAAVTISFNIQQNKISQLETLKGFVGYLSSDNISEKKTAMALITIYDPVVASRLISSILEDKEQEEIYAAAIERSTELIEAGVTNPNEAVKIIEKFKEVAEKTDDDEIREASLHNLEHIARQETINPRIREAAKKALENTK